MDDLMTVFGFGRQGLTKYLDQVPMRFSIALLESSQHDHIAQWADAVLSRGDSEW